MSQFFGFCQSALLLIQLNLTSQVKRRVYVERGLLADGIDGLWRPPIDGERQRLV